MAPFKLCRSIALPTLCSKERPPHDISNISDWKTPIDNVEWVLSASGSRPRFSGCLVALSHTCYPAELNIGR